MKPKIEKAVKPQDKPEAFKLSEIGYTGFNLVNGITDNEIHRELAFPRSIQTFTKMTYSVPVNASLSLYENLISKVSWRVLPPADATEQEKDQAKFVEECLHDMQTPFRQVIKDCLSSNIYGFAVLEKVFRRRNENSGSLYRDNKIALKKLAIRHQESIEKFIIDDESYDVVGVKQNLSGISLGTVKPNSTVIIPRDKFLLISVGRNRSDPYGKSMLRDAYLAWRYLEVLSEMEATGVAKDLQGLPVLRAPAQIMSADATTAQKAIYENLKNIVRNLQTNSQSGVVIPSDIDPETRAHLFDLTLLSTEGGKKNYDVSKIKEYYQNQIYTSLFADVLILGSNGVGSFALGQIKNSLTGAAAESMLDNIVDAFNRDVIRHLYELNGWDASRCARLDYEGLHAADLETISKYLQRCASVGLWLKDSEGYNFVRKVIGLDAIEDEEKIKELATDFTSRSGDGMATPFEGTRTSGTDQNDNDSNLDNAG